MLRAAVVRHRLCGALRRKLPDWVTSVVRCDGWLSIDFLPLRLQDKAMSVATRGEHLTVAA